MIDAVPQDAAPHLETLALRRIPKSDVSVAHNEVSENYVITLLGQNGVETDRFYCLWWGGTTALTITPVTFSDPSPRQAADLELFGCVPTATTALDVERYGLTFGFIGNEAYSVEEELK